MACKLTVIDLTQDAGDDSQTLKTTLHRFIAIEQDFAEDFALQAVGEIEKLWPDLKAERFASQDILELATALRTARVSLEYRMLRAFLVACKDQIKKRNNMSSKELAELAESLHGLIARQLGPVEEKSSAIIVEERKSAVVVEERSSTVIHVVTDVQPTSTTDGVSEHNYTNGYRVDHFRGDYPDELRNIFEWDRVDDDFDYEDIPEELRKLWPDLDGEFIPKVKHLKMMVRDLCRAGFDLEVRLWRPFVVCWMANRPSIYNAPNGKRAERARKMALAQLGPGDMVTHDDGGITILRKEGEQDYNPAEDPNLDEEKREQARRHRLVTEVLYPRHRAALSQRTSRKRKAEEEVRDTQVRFKDIKLENDASLE